MPSCTAEGSPCYDLGKESIADGDPAAATIDISMHTIKFGVIFKF